MDKAVLISIRPKWCELIASGKKTVEVRKTRPKLEMPFKCYIYCTLTGSNEFFTNDLHGDVAEWNRGKWWAKKGTVIGEFVCDKIYGIVPDENGWGEEYGYSEHDCLSDSEMLEYLGDSSRGGYGWHISDLVIYDEPKELSEFCKPCPYEHMCSYCGYYFPGIEDYGRCEPPCCGFWEDNASMIIHPPQSWMYVEELEE